MILEPTIRRPENSLNWIRLARSPCGEEIDGAYKNLSVAVPNSVRTSVGKFLANYVLQKALHRSGIHCGAEIRLQHMDDKEKPSR